MKEPIWIELRDVLAIHSRLIGIEGGNARIRDLGLLQSALARPRQIYAYGEKPDTSALAAAYVAGIINNHAFIDGNKRTGFVLGVLFLESNGYTFHASEESATQIIISVASGTTDESAFAEWLRANTKHSQT